jgi:hypothetical protein
LAGAGTTAAALAQQGDDDAYAEKIREYTTDERFLNELIDHLPASESVPSPLDHFGTIIGAPDILHDTDEIYGYMRALAAASPRVEVHTIGRTEEGREMIEVIIADEATLAGLDSYRDAVNRLADPRRVSEDEALKVIAGAKPIYYITAGLHSPETGPPEMVMELAYRLAVEETPFINSIRNGAITIIVPATEPDGRDRMVDTYRYRKANDGVGPSLRYWGKYVAHDNNRDGNGFGLALTRNILNAYLHWKPTVMHDLHESGYFLYTSTGSGPYNEQLDPLTIDEWHNLAHEEVTQLTKRGTRSTRGGPPTTSCGSPILGTPSGGSTRRWGTGERTRESASCRRAPRVVSGIAPILRSRRSSGRCATTRTTCSRASWSPSSTWRRTAENTSRTSTCVGSARSSAAGARLPMRG